MDELADYLETLDLNNATSSRLVKRTDDLPQILRLVAALGGFDFRHSERPGRLIG